MTTSARRRIARLLPDRPSRSAPAEPMREYAVVLLTAALVTFLTTPVVRMVAIRCRMMAAPRERDVHVIPTPRGGGVAMYLGVAAGGPRRHPAAGAAADLRRLPDDAVLVAGGLICLLGVLDDKWGLDALTKLTGQIAAAGVMVLLGVQLAFLFLPVADIGTISLGPGRRRAADHPADRR